MKKSRTIFPVIVTLLALTISVPALGYERFGKITPNQPYDIWLDINELVPLLTPVASKYRAAKQVRAGAFSGKTPTNVLSNVEIFRARLDRIRAKYGLEKTRVYRSDTGEKVSPAIVYINSGHVFDAVVELLLKTNPKDETYRNHFFRQYPKGKTPTHVFELVDMAIRRLDRVG